MYVANLTARTSAAHAVGLMAQLITQGVGTIDKNGIPD